VRKFSMRCWHCLWILMRFLPHVLLLYTPRVQVSIIYSHKRRPTKINPCPVEFDEGFALLEFQKNLNSFGSHHLVLESRNSFVILRINLFGCHGVGTTKIQLRTPWISFLLVPCHFCKFAFLHGHTL
jgi:hypothetical protein